MAKDPPDRARWLHGLDHCRRELEIVKKDPRTNQRKNETEKFNESWQGTANTLTN